MDPKLAFSNVPDEIWDLWLNDRIENNGWPPEGDTWARVLGNKSLADWNKLCWEKRTITIPTADVLSQNSINMIFHLMEYVFNDQENAYSREIPSSPKRVWSALEYIGENKTIPSKLILIEENEKYEVIDGFHRLSAFFYLKPELGDVLSFAEHQAWIGYYK